MKVANYLLRVIVLFILALSSSWASATGYQVVAEFDRKDPPGNIAVTRQGRIFMSTHHFFGADYKIVEVEADGNTAPYPTASFSQSLNPVLGIVVDAQGILWILETASGKDRAGRLIGWDTVNNRLYKMIYLAAPIIPENSFLNDIAVDRTHDAIYITDTATPANSALIVVDLATGEARRVLEGSSFTRPENIDMVIDGKSVTLGGQPARIGANPITIDHQDKWVYFAPMTGTALYRVATKDLLNKQLSPSQLIDKVERYADKPISDGITIDNQGNIYITDITADAVGYIDAQRRYQILFKDKEFFSWADGFANAEGQEIYVTVNKLHKSPVLNNGNDDSGNRYYILKFASQGNTSAGR